MRGFRGARFEGISTSRLACFRVEAEPEAEGRRRQTTKQERKEQTRCSGCIWLGGASGRWSEERRPIAAAAAARPQTELAATRPLQPTPRAFVSQTMLHSAIEFFSVFVCTSFPPLALVRVPFAAARARCLELTAAAADQPRVDSSHQLRLHSAQLSSAQLSSAPTSAMESTDGGTRTLRVTIVSTEGASRRRRSGSVHGRHRNTL